MGDTAAFLDEGFPAVAGSPSRLAIFLAACVVLFLAGAGLTRGAPEREPAAGAAPRPERSPA